MVERDESNRYVQHARGLGAPVVHGDATLGQTLRSVNLAQAGAVAILTSDDLVNLETGLAVRDELGDRWNEVPVVLRVFDRALGSRLQQTFNFNHVWSTAALASPWFVGAVLGLEILATFYVRNQPFLVARLEVARGRRPRRPRDAGARRPHPRRRDRPRWRATARASSTRPAATPAWPPATVPTSSAPTRSSSASSAANGPARSEQGSGVRGEGRTLHSRQREVRSGSSPPAVHGPSPTKHGLENQAIRWTQGVR